MIAIISETPRQLPLDYYLYSAQAAHRRHLVSRTVLHRATEPRFVSYLPCSRSFFSFVVIFLAHFFVLPMRFSRRL